MIKPDRAINTITVVSALAAIAYTFAMLVFPWFNEGWNWGRVQDVWDRWQGLNVGVLAFLSSVTAFSISRYNANNQRQRDFLAAKAFLPGALSELVSYFKESASIFREGWEARRGTRPEVAAPSLPAEYKNVFKDCIQHATPAIGDRLAKILALLQVHDSRLRSFVRDGNNREFLSPDRHNLIVYLYRLGELQALVGKLFGFARNTEQFDDAPLTWDEYHNAFGNLDLHIEDFVIDEEMNLEQFTKRAIARGDENT